MSRPAFAEQLRTRHADTGSMLCVGLDPQLKTLPHHLVSRHNDGAIMHTVLESFLVPLVDATARHALAFKPNLAFYNDTMDARNFLPALVSYIHSKYPKIPVIGDGKRGDIAKTNEGNAKEYFDFLGVDAGTVNPYFGEDTYPPFTAYSGRGIIALCKTSNAGSPKNQDLLVDLRASNKHGVVTDEELQNIREITGKVTIPYYWLMAYRHGQYNKQNPNIGIVVGATHPKSFGPVRSLYGNGYILIPGVGSQGGDLEETLRLAVTEPEHLVLVNSSSGITGASRGYDFAEAAGAEAQRLSQRIRENLPKRVL